MKRVNLLAAGVFALVPLFPVTVSAAPVTLVGTTVDFMFDDALSGLYGAASVSGNTLFFTPTDFDTRSLNGTGFNLSKATFNVRIAAHAGHAFSNLNLTERGDYLLVGTGAMVDVGGQLRAFDVAAPLADLTASIAATTPINGLGLPTRNWNAAASVDVSSLNARTLNVTVENLLLASTAAPGSIAFIEKKFAGLSVNTLAVTPVPEADTWAMMLAGLGLVGGMALRRRMVP